MAKKKKAPEPSSKGAGKKKATKPAAPAAKKRKAGPRAQSLPGMEQARHTFLDSSTATIAEILERQNQDATDLLAEKQSSLKYMASHNVHSYVQNGVRLTHQPGVDKLSVRQVKAEGETTVSDENASERQAAKEDEGAAGNNE